MSPSTAERTAHLLAAIALALLLLYGPGLVQVAWSLLAPGASPKSYFAPTEIVGVLVPVVLLSVSRDKAEVLRWRPVRPALAAWAAAATLGLAGLLTYAQTLWERFTHISPPVGMKDLLAIGSPADLAWLLVGAVALPALAEESAFRGFLQTGFERWIWPPGAILLSTVLFGMFHHDAYGVPTYLVMGTFLGWLAWRTGSILPGAAAHATNNLLALATFNGLPEEWWWANALWLAPLAAILAVLGLGGLIRGVSQTT